MNDQASGTQPGLRHRMARTTKAAVLFTSICALTFVFYEGAASTLLFAHHLLFRSRGTLPSRTHVQYDAELGWVNTPGTLITDMYGPGKSVAINDRGFRTVRPDDPGPTGSEPALICSGDSFTLGVGVRIEDTWCHRLAEARGMEYINLGHAGYGIDQAYLRYQREVGRLPRGVHVFAFIMDDFRRAAVDRFVGYAKPYVTLAENGTDLTSRPVPRHSGFGPWLAMHGGVFLELRGVELVGLAAHRRTASDAGWIGDQARGPTLAMFERIQREDRARGTFTVFVFLKENAQFNNIERGLSEWLATELSRREIPFLDLTRDFYRLPFEDLLGMFDPGWGHYSEAGNTRVAERLDAFLPATHRGPLRAGA